MTGFLFTFIAISVLAILAFPLIILKNKMKGSRCDKENVLSSLKTLERNPEDIYALEHLGWVRYEEKNYKEAYHYYSKLVVLISNNDGSHRIPSLDRYQVYLNFGISAYHIGEKAESFTCLQKARLVINNTNTFKLFYYIGLINFEKDNYLDASSAFHTALEQAPNHKETRTKLAICNYQLGKFDRALPLLEELSNPEEPGELDFFRAISLVQLNKKEEALDCLTNVANRLEEYRLRCWYEMAKIYLEQKATERTVEVCQDIISLGDTAGIEELSFAYYEGAKIFAKMGSIDKAAKMLGALLKFNNSYQDAAILYKRYRASQDCPQLFRLLEGDEEVRRRTAIKLADVLVPNLVDIEIISEGAGVFEVSAYEKKNKDKYYIWACFQDKKVTMRQVFHAHVNSKQYGCVRCVLASLSGFEQDTETYVKGRPITLISKSELKEYIDKIDG